MAELTLLAHYKINLNLNKNSNLYFQKQILISRIFFNQKNYKKSEENQSKNTKK